MSAQHIVRLEQGRTAHPSAQVLSALGRAFRLSTTEVDHMFHLAGLASPHDKLVPRHVTPGVMRLVDRLTESAAVVVCTSAWETVYWNPRWDALVGDPARGRGRERNVAWRHFTGLPTDRVGRRRGVHLGMGDGVLEPAVGRAGRRPRARRGRERNFAWRHFTGLPTDRVGRRGVHLGVGDGVLEPAVGRAGR